MNQNCNRNSRSSINWCNSYRITHSFSGLSTDLIIKGALKRQTHDNVTCVFISLEDYDESYISSLHQHIKLKMIMINYIKLY